MGSKPKTGLGGQPKQKTGKEPKQGIGESQSKELVRNLEVSARTAQPNNEIPNSTTTTSGLPADRTMSSNEREKPVVKPSTGGDERVLAADGRSWVKRGSFGQSGDDDDDRVMASDGRSWVKRDVASRVTTVSRSTMPSKSQRWGKKGPSLEVQKREEVPGSDEVRLTDSPLSPFEPESGPTPAFLSNDFDWSRRSSDAVNLARKMERANADGDRSGHSDEFITVDKRSAPPSESTLSDVAKRDHSDILWEFIPEGQSRVGSTFKS
ncbi:hypothetical protein QFC22_002691 [Naganishia vaughanmartiniae]|uniref:Uncharacterized protein n=1 Tax=Naganishia vaughanmartiniae TaxID=1424756 RepID=A0ACC2X9Q0_9TREE|nr:hypothetical protein QFC22_002691 [Naganishia vaughanmartiniae]